MKIVIEEDGGIISERLLISWHILENGVLFVCFPVGNYLTQEVSLVKQLFSLE